MNKVLQNDIMLFGLGALALMIFFANSKTIVSTAVTGTVDAIQGAGEAINASIINPAVRAATGDPSATLGGKVWEWLHPAAADELRNGAKIDPPGSIGTTDPFQFG